MTTENTTTGNDGQASTGALEQAPLTEVEKARQLIDDGNRRDLRDVESQLGKLGRDQAELQKKRKSLREDLKLDEAEKQQTIEDGKTLLAHLQQVQRDFPTKDLQSLIGGRSVAKALQPHVATGAVKTGGKGSATTYRAS